MSDSVSAAPSIAIDAWRRLYDAALKIRALAPWKWMEETALFGVQDPKTGQVGFVSATGAPGENSSITVYLGQQGLNGFWQLQNSSDEEAGEIFFSTPFLQLIFERKTDLELEDSAIIQNIELSIQNPELTPCFRSLHPGYYPWFLVPGEEDFLLLALEQTLAVGARVKENPDLLFGEDHDSYLVRVQEGDEWQDRWMRFFPDQHINIDIPADPYIEVELQRLPQTTGAVEVDLFPFPGPIGAKSERPRNAFVVLLVDAGSGIVLAFDLLHIETDRFGMYAEIPNFIIRKLAEKRVYPSEIHFRKPILKGFLQSICKPLQIRILRKKEMPMTDLAVNALLENIRSHS